MAGPVLPVVGLLASLMACSDAVETQPVMPAPARDGPVAEVSPPLVFRGAQRLQLQCVVTSDRPTQDERFAPSLCSRIRDLVAQGGQPAPTLVPIGDPAVLAANAVTLLVHGSLQQLGQRRVLSFTMRPYRNSSEQTGVLFGTAPAVVDVTDLRSAAAPLDRALRGALANALPPTSRTGVDEVTS